VAPAAAQAPQLLIEAPPELAAVAAELRALGGEDFSEVLRLTGRPGFSRPIAVVLAPESSALAHDTPGWVSGYARGDDALIVLFPARVRSYPDTNLRTLLHHEIAHVLVAEAAAGRPVPRWFNEGVATVAAREWGLEDRARFAAAVVGRGPGSTRELDTAFSGTAAEARRAYALSAAFVRFLQREHGPQAPAEILAGLARGLDFDDSFLRATGVPLASAEHTFFEDEIFWTTWIPFLTSTGALWMAVTALALLAIHRRRVRSRRMLERWEAEEGPVGRVIRRRDRSDDEPAN
jgi:hypothetical protein